MYRLNSRNRFRIPNSLALAVAAVLALTLLIEAPWNDDQGVGATSALASLAPGATKAAKENDEARGKRGFNIPLLLFRGR